MPYQPQEKTKTRLAPNKSKVIVKNHRNNQNQQKAEYETPEKEYTDQNTMSDSPSSTDKNEKKIYSHCMVLMLIKHLHSVLHYGKDTLYVCLQLLNRLKIQIEQHKCKLYSAALLQMAAKVHEFRTPRYSDLVAWGNYTFSREELVMIEGQLLLHFDFRIPTALNFPSIKHAEEAIRQLQLKITSPQISNTFQ